MALCSERPFPALHGAVGTPGRCETLGHAILQRPNPSLRRRPPYFCPVLLLVQMGGEYLGARYPSPKKEIRHIKKRLQTPRIFVAFGRNHCKLVRVNVCALPFVGLVGAARELRGREGHGG